jgi:hypothetical protein
MRARAGLIALVLWPAGCLVSIDESLLDRADGALPDGGSAEASAPDSSTDGGSVDGEGGPSSPLPCNVDIDAGIFCDDFDVDPIEVRWSKQLVFQGTLSLIKSDPRSPPNALAASVVAGTAGTQREALLVRPFSKVARTKCTMNVRVPALDESVYTTFIVIERSSNFLNPSSTDQTIKVEATANASRVLYEPILDGGLQSYEHPFAALGTFWRDLEFELEANKLLLKINGATVVDTSLAKEVQEHVRLHIGARSTSGAGRVVVFDNVRCAVTYL